MEYTCRMHILVKIWPSREWSRSKEPSNGDWRIDCWSIKFFDKIWDWAGLAKSAPPIWSFWIICRSSFFTWNWLGQWWYRPILRTFGSLDTKVWSYGWRVRRLQIVWVWKWRSWLLPWPPHLLGWDWDEGWPSPTSFCWLGLVASFWEVSVGLWKWYCFPALLILTL